MLLPLYKAITSGKASCRNLPDCIKLLTLSLSKGATIATDAPPVGVAGVSLVRVAGVSLVRVDGVSLVGVDGVS